MMKDTQVLLIASGAPLPEAHAADDVRAHSRWAARHVGREYSALEVVGGRRCGGEVIDIANRKSVM